MIVTKEPNTKLKSSSKTEPKTSTKSKSTMEAKEPKSPGFLSSVKNRLKPSQPKAGSLTSKWLETIIEESIKEKMPYVANKNIDSSKNEEEEKAPGDNESGHSIDSDNSKK